MNHGKINCVLCFDLTLLFCVCFCFCRMICVWVRSVYLRRVELRLFPTVVSKPLYLQYPRLRFFFLSQLGFTIVVSSLSVFLGFTESLSSVYCFCWVSLGQCLGFPRVPSCKTKMTLTRFEIGTFDGKSDFGSWKKKMRVLFSHHKVLIALETGEWKWKA